MKTDWKEFHTTDSLLDKYRTKRRLREELVNKIAVYDLAIADIQAELIRRGFTETEIKK